MKLQDYMVLCRLRDCYSTLSAGEIFEKCRMDSVKKNSTFDSEFHSVMYCVYGGPKSLTRKEM